MTKVKLPDSTEVIVSVQEGYILVETETIDFEELKRQAKQSALKKQDKSWTGPGGSTQQLHHKYIMCVFDGAEIGSTGSV